MSENAYQRQLSNNGLTEVGVVPVDSTLSVQLSTSNLTFLPAEIIEMIRKFLDRENKKKLRLVNERYLFLIIDVNVNNMIKLIHDLSISEE